jgi:hypothetical protein
MYNKDKTILIDRRELLRIKFKSLAEEARIIRREERRTFGSLRDQMYCHRIHVVRSEARITHLAYGFLRGRTLAQIESIRYTEPNWDRVVELIHRYGPLRGVTKDDVLAAVTKWRNEPSDKPVDLVAPKVPKPSLQQRLSNAVAGLRTRNAVTS